MKEYEQPQLVALDIVTEQSLTPRTEIGVGSNTLPPEDEDW